MIQHWRLLILLVTLFGTVAAVGLKPLPYGRDGVQVAFVDPSSPFSGVVRSGMVITEVNSQKVTSTQVWDTLSVQQGTVTLKANGRPYTAVANGTLGINVNTIERTNIDFGIDIRGGTRIILQPAEVVDAAILDETINILQTRANLFGLTEMKFTAVQSLGGGQDGFIQVEAAGIGSDIIQNLLSRQGKFEAKIQIPITDKLTLGDKSYTVVRENNTVRIDGTLLVSNQTVVFNSVPIELSNDSAILLATVYEGKDIERISNDPQQAGVVQSGGSYQFFFPISVSAAGAERFAKATSGLDTTVDLNSGQEYLSGDILLLIDGRLESQLRISSELKSSVQTTTQITGSRNTQEEAAAEKLSLQTILRSGALPVKLETASVDVISPTLGQGFLSSALTTVLLAILLVAVVAFIRYRSLKIALPMVLISLSEVAIIVGVSAKNDTAIWLIVLVLNLIIIGAAWMKKQAIDIFAWAGAILVPLFGMVSWTLDLPAIAGIIAAIGTGIDHQIIIADETIKGQKKEIIALKDNIKRAFFIIFASAATMLAAMVPLMFVGVGLVRGFAITTIIGIFIGTLITRPAYGSIIEGFIGRAHKKQQEKAQAAEQSAHNPVP